MIKNIEKNSYDLQMRQFFLEVAMILQQRDKLFDFRDQVGDFHLNN